MGILALMLEPSRNYLMLRVDSGFVCGEICWTRSAPGAHSHTMDNQLRTEAGKGNPTVQLKQSIGMASTSGDSMCLVIQLVTRMNRLMRFPLSLSTVHTIQQSIQEQWYFMITKAPTYSTPPKPFSHCQIRVKLNRVFFPHPSPFPWLWFRWTAERDSGNLINPFMRITNWMTRHLATLREPWLLPPFSRA